jgi:hypothetical protein
MSEGKLIVDFSPKEPNTVKRYYLLEEKTGHIIARLSNGDLKPMSEEMVKANAIKLAKGWNQYDLLLQRVKEIRQSIIDAGYLPDSILVKSIDTLIEKAA